MSSPRERRGLFSRIFSPYKDILGGKKQDPLIVLPTKNIVGKTETVIVHNVSKSFGRNKVLEKIDLEIPPHKIFGVIGINGSGKTTLLKTIIGFYKPETGAITFGKKQISENLKENMRSFGFATQSDSFYGNLTVAENVRYFGELYGLTDEWIAAHMENVLKLVKLWEAKNVHANNLSTGMKRRLDIACALIHDPSILILDEPTEDLDPSLRGDMLNLIKKINKNGTTIIMSSHLLDEVEQVCDYVAILSEGKILKSGTPNQLKNFYTKCEEIILESSPGNYDKLLKKIKTWKNIDKSGVHDNKLVIYAEKGEKVLHKLLPILKRSKEQVVNLNVRKPTLSEVFIALTRYTKK